MNVLYLHCHDAGRYISPYGYAMPTPNLMRLAEQGTLFRQAHCAAPTCSPSRAALLTGMTAHQAGMLGLAHRGFSLTDRSKHLAHFLRSQGYETVLSGIQHEYLKEFADKGYDHILYDGEEGQEFISDDRPSAKAAAKYLSESHDKPFFLSCGFIYPHRDFPESSVNPAYVQPPAPLPDTPEVRKDMAAYMTAVQEMDTCTGQVLDALATGPNEANTLIIFTTDHGIAFPWMKCQLYDTGTGVALITKIPGQANAPTVSDALVSHLDIFPTICDYLEINLPEWLQGQSMRPLMENRTDSIRNEVFAEVSFHASYEPMRAIRTERHKLIRIFDSETTFPPPNVDDGISKDTLAADGLFELNRGPVQLYDLYLDPHERNNLFDDQNYQEVLVDLNRRLTEWMRDTEDPLHLQKQIIPPADAKINQRDSWSPAGDEWV